MTSGEQERASDLQRVRDLMDLHDGRPGPVATLDDKEMAAVLRAARRIAVVGASSNPARPSYGVFAYLLGQGYECVPINPNETEVQGVPAFATIGEAVTATGPVDIVDMFRRSELCVPHAEEAVAVGAAVSYTHLTLPTTPYV